MSVQAMSWAMTQQVVTAAPERHVLLCLANYAGHDGKNAFPSAKTLANDTGLSVRTVRYKLDALEAAGLISIGNQKVAAAHIERSDRRPVCYDLNLERGAGDASGTERGAAQDATGCSSQQSGVQLTTERGAGAAANPSYKPSDEPSPKPLRKKPARKMPDDFVANETHQTLANEAGVDLTNEVASFTDHHLAKDSKFADWDRALNTWLRNAKKWGRAKNVHQLRPKHTGLDRASADGLNRRSDGGLSL